MLAAVAERVDPARAAHALRAGDRALEVEGLAQPILSGERVALNFLQRLSGIATATRRLKALLKGTRASLLDIERARRAVEVSEQAREHAQRLRSEARGRRLDETPEAERGNPSDGG